MVENKTSLLDSPTGEKPVIATPVPSAPREDSVLYAHPVAVLQPPALDSLDAENNAENHDENARHDQVVVASGVAGGVLGLLLGGPILALLGGFGASYLCKEQTAAGDIARAMGDVALTARDKFSQVNEKHQFTTRTQQAASQALERAKEYDRQHHVVAKTKEFLVFSWTKIKDVNREHRVVERAVQKMGEAVSFLVKKLAGQDSHANETTTTEPRARNGYTKVPSNANEPMDKTRFEAQPF